MIHWLIRIYKKNSVKKKSIQEYEWNSDIRRFITRTIFSESARFFPNSPEYEISAYLWNFSNQVKFVYKKDHGYIELIYFNSKFISYRFKCSRITSSSRSNVLISLEKEIFSFRRRIYGSKWYWEEWRVKFWTLGVHTYAHGPLLIPAHWSHSLEAYSRS